MSVAGPKLTRLVVLDVDGVLTDGGLYYGPEGEAYQRFNAYDGYGIRCLLDAGIEVAILSGRRSAAVTQRAQALGIKRVVQGAGDKAAAFREIVKHFKLELNEVAFVGDDVFDLPVMRLAGWSAAPLTARAEVRAAADYVAGAAGGHGAVREVAEEILRARGAWPPAATPSADTGL